MAKTKEKNVQTIGNVPDLELVVDDGIRRVPIKNKAGEEIGVLSFRPTDVGIIHRFNETASKFAEIVAPLEEYSIAPDGTAADETDPGAVEALKEAEKRLYEAVDYIFDGNVSQAFFGRMNPFSPVNGAFYCESALNAVGSLIATQFEQETRKINQRTAKYLAPYSSKKGKKK